MLSIVDRGNAASAAKCYSHLARDIDPKDYYMRDRDQ